MRGCGHGGAAFPLYYLKLSRKNGWPWINAHRTIRYTLLLFHFKFCSNSFFIETFAVFRLHFDHISLWNTSVYYWLHQRTSFACNKNYWIFSYQAVINHIDVVGLGPLQYVFTNTFPDICANRGTNWVPYPLTHHNRTSWESCRTIFVYGHGGIGRDRNRRTRCDTSRSVRRHMLRLLS